ncbi:lipoprotein-releasing ABC transporter permease subunit [Alteromonas oceanisediminis]|uniref:lipoprotein-releasing ABC transporter permease subunit n=1 Tax=Alteromonas oceanisediminis TaxID=2836180 RepID=UPI001BD9ACE9|nr:lipoprotein-releasing ABC transporter permease subunit [Alteromonas oceanisediminis]MBT0587262.1 lipoprotein-releasing ABC transporter permease subunit [Alteromonas oceanisediminis]
MFQPLFASIGLRYTRASQSSSFVSFINFFSVAGITLGIMALIVVLSVMNGFEGQLKQRVLGIVPHITVSAPIAETRRVDHPAIVTRSAYLQAEGVLQTPQALHGVMMQGVVPEDMTQFSIVAAKMVAGRFSDLTEGSYRIIIGQALATTLNLRPGDRVRLLVAGATLYTPMGRVPSQRVAEVAGIYAVGSALDDKAIYLHVNDLQRLMRQRAEQQHTRVFLTDPFDYQQVADTFEQQEFSFTTWRSQQGPLFDAVKMEKNMMFLLLVLVIAVAAFNIVSALVMVVNEKQSDIAILKTLGMRKRSVMAIFLFNGVFNGFKGAILGTLLGLVVVWQLNPLLHAVGINMGYSDSGGLPIELELYQVVAVAVFAMLLCFLATLYPAYRALSTQPARALQYE